MLKLASGHCPDGKLVMRRQEACNEETESL